jgi:hypothetical protein
MARALVTLADQVFATARCPKIFFTTTAPVRTAFQLVIWHKELLKDGKVAAQWWKENLEIFVRVASHRRLNASRRSVCTIRKHVARAIPADLELNRICVQILGSRRVTRNREPLKPLLYIASRVAVLLECPLSEGFCRKEEFVSPEFGGLPDRHEFQR